MSENNWTKPAFGVATLEQNYAHLEQDCAATLFLDTHARVPQSDLELWEWVAAERIQLSTEVLIAHVHQHYDRLHREGLLPLPPGA